jgi:hypothetical protein
LSTTRAITVIEVRRDRGVQAAGRVGGAANVIRQHMKQLQHNKTIIVDGPATKLVVCGSTNFSWRGLYVQNNTRSSCAAAAGDGVLERLQRVLEERPGALRCSGGGLDAARADGINAEVTFSPHGAGNERLQAIADDHQDDHVVALLFAGVSGQDDRRASRRAHQVTKIRAIRLRHLRQESRLLLQKTEWQLAPVFAKEIAKNLPEPSDRAYRRLRHAHAPQVRGHRLRQADRSRLRWLVQLLTHADTKNGENLIIFRDQRIAVSYMVEALRIFDHYHFRVCRPRSRRSSSCWRGRRESRKRSRGGRLYANTRSTATSALA